MFGENRDAAIQMMEKYDPDLMGKIALALFKHHRTNQITYQYDEEAESLYKTIFDKYNAQFNLKYSCYISNISFGHNKSGSSFV